MKSKNRAFFMYALGYLGIAILTQTTVKWYQYYYAPPEMNQYGLQALIPIGFIGIAMIIARLIDGITDPVVAYISDKLGRRIPFILYGTVPLIVTFILLWFPPVHGESVINLVYLTIILSLFFTFFTIVVVPYLALIGEITDSNKGRIKITTLQGITQIVGLMIAEAGSGLLINAYNFKVMAVILGSISLLSILLTPLFIKEGNISNDLKSSANQMSMFGSMKMTLLNRNFAIYLSSYVTVWFGINTLTITMPYISEVMLGKTADHSGYLIAGTFVLAFLFSPFIPLITKRYSKKQIMFFTSLFFALILASTGLFGTLISYFYAAALVILAGIPLAVILIIPNAMVIDIAKQDTIRHRQNRTGMFFGIQGLVIKIVIGISSLYTPVLFKTFGYSSLQPLGIQLAGPICAVIIAIGAIILLKYSTTGDENEGL